MLSTCHWFIGFLKGTQTQETWSKRQINLVCLSVRSWICAPFPFLPSTSHPALILVQMFPVLLISYLFSLPSSVSQREISANGEWAGLHYLSGRSDLAIFGQSVVSNFSSILNFIQKSCWFFKKALFKPIKHSRLHFLKKLSNNLSHWESWSLEERSLGGTSYKFVETWITHRPYLVLFHQFLINGVLLHIFAVHFSKCHWNQLCFHGLCFDTQCIPWAFLFYSGIIKINCFFLTRLYCRYFDWNRI